MGSISGTGSAGIADASARFERLAARTASGESDPAEVAGEAAATRVQMAASVAVARAANDMMGTLLDILA